MTVTMLKCVDKSLCVVERTFLNMQRDKLSPTRAGAPQPHAMITTDCGAKQ